jgi:hypothetical protein
LEKDKCGRSGREILIKDGGKKRNEEPKNVMMNWK